MESILFDNPEFKDLSKKDKRKKAVEFGWSWNYVTECYNRAIYNELDEDIIKVD